MRVLWVVAVLVFALDQAVKYWVVQVMDLKSRLFVPVADPYLNLVMAWNRGINFGWLAGDADLTRWVLIAVALLITGWVVWWMSQGHSRLACVSAGLLVGGALGNVVDRLIYGAVADFLNMSCCGFQNPYAFNIADISIFIGAFGLILFTGEKKTP